MDTKVSYREINIENPQTGNKVASTALPAGMWLHSSGFLLNPLVPNETVLGLNMTPVPATDATNDAITYDGINSTEDRWIMPVANTIAYSGLIGTFTVGETVSGGTSGALGIIIADSGSDMSVTTITGVFVVGETITGLTSGATATISSVTSVPSVGGPQRADIAADSISLDMNTLGYASTLQFEITKIISPSVVEVAVRRLQL